MGQAGVVENIEGIENYLVVFYTIKDVNEPRWSETTKFLQWGSELVTPGKSNS